jgi:hypothetical protein
MTYAAKHFLYRLLYTLYAAVPHDDCNSAHRITMNFIISRTYLRLQRLGIRLAKTGLGLASSAKPCRNLINLRLLLQEALS